MAWISGNEYTIPTTLQEFDGRQIIFFNLSGSTENSPRLNLRLSNLQSMSIDGENNDIVLPDS